MTQEFLNRINEIIEEYQGIIIWITVDSTSNKIVAHMNHSCSDYKNYEDRVKKSIAEAAREFGMQHLRIATE
jgi:3-methyladenine DNA glycosylase AlkD